MSEHRFSGRVVFGAFLEAKMVKKVRKFDLENGPFFR